MNPIITKLKNDCCPYNQIRKFSDKPGIYAFFFTGKDFPIADYNPQKDEIIYIGKTESSQASRDEKTHFASGKTGSSTVRKSLGALLKEILFLKPIPRNDNDFIARRLSHFTFDELSEEKLTNWMKDNLGLSFFEFNKPPIEIDALETKLIKETRPLLNIDHKNPDNPHAKTIKTARRACADEANKAFMTMSTFYETQNNPTKPGSTNRKNVKANVHKYEYIFKNVLPQIETAIDEAGTRSQSIQLLKTDFKDTSDRKVFSFNLLFSNGTILKGTKGKAMARDLARVLEQNPKIIQKLRGKNVQFTLDKEFTLSITKI